jgi:hypothetical protein
MRSRGTALSFLSGAGVAAPATASARQPRRALRCALAVERWHRLHCIRIGGRALCNLCKRHLAVTHERSGLPAKLSAARQLVGARRAHTATLTARFAVATAARRAGDARASAGRERALVSTSCAAAAVRANLQPRRTRSSS